MEYTGRGHSIHDVGLAQAKYALDTTNHYFEFEIVDQGEKGFVAIGLARRVCVFTFFRYFHFHGFCNHAYYSDLLKDIAHPQRLALNLLPLSHIIFGVGLEIIPGKLLNRPSLGIKDACLKPIGSINI